MGEGNVDLGITGQDVILEAEMASRTKELLELGFGKCKLQVQVPLKGPVQSAEDLAGKRVVTSFKIIANSYFGKLEGQLEHRGWTYKKTAIEYVGGSVEAACALGLADGIGTPYLSRSLNATLTQNYVSAVDLVGKRHVFVASLWHL